MSKNTIVSRTDPTTSKTNIIGTENLISKSFNKYILQVLCEKLKCDLEYRYRKC